MKQVKFHYKAKSELIEVSKSYKYIQYNLGKKFIMEIDKNIKFITTHPTMFPMYKRGIRKCVLKRFPYSIFFEDKENMILILAISHHKRDSSFWINRLNIEN